MAFPWCFGKILIQGLYVFLTCYGSSHSGRYALSVRLAINLSANAPDLAVVERQRQLLIGQQTVAGLPPLLKGDQPLPDVHCPGHRPAESSHFASQDC